MAWFGCDALLDQTHPTVNPAAVRIAQGGAESIPCIVFLEWRKRSNGLRNRLFGVGSRPKRDDFSLVLLD